MALDALQVAEVINALEIFLDKRRPAEHIRHELDYNYKIENQSIIIFGIRPHWKRRDNRKPCCQDYLGENTKNVENLLDAWKS